MKPAFRTAFLLFAAFAIGQLEPARADTSVDPAKGSTAQPSDGACDKDSETGSFKIGFGQAMSGSRNMLTLKYNGAVIQPKSKSCIEYDKGTQDRKCCLQGFEFGARILGDKLFLLDTGRVPATDGNDEEKACLKSFRTGKRQASTECENLGKGLCIQVGLISNKDKHLGCVSFGYAARMLTCPYYDGNRQALRLSLGNGALVNRSIAKAHTGVSTATETATQPVSTQARPDQPPSGN